MNSEIICVGTELLVGDILNTNAKYISEKLASAGINLYYQTVVGDNHERLKEVLDTAYKRADLVILTGGLGPTIDDITKQVVAEYHGEKLVKVDKYYDILKKRYFQMGAEVPAGGVKEVSILENSKLLENVVGIAPGFLYEKGNKLTAVMPGPPGEMTVMFDKELMPVLSKYSNDLIRFRTLKIIGVPEGKLDEELAEYFVMSNPTVAPYAKTGEVHVRIGAKGENEEELEKEISKIEKEIREIYPDNIYTTGDENFYDVVVRTLHEKSLTLATAESITGGKIADYIVSVSGASKVYKGGYITYSNEEKERLLGIDKDKIELYGAVSSEICMEMLNGLEKNIPADVYITTTGVAGPDKDEKGNEVGTVFIGLSIKGQKSVKKYNYSGLRNSIRERTVRTALLDLWKSVK
jgi:nicotinamide-nucleotide amidase